ncbi:serine hydrolase domain-containing protein [Aquimarina algiphila]|uniref:serine hydrolase domain-containing protein n=1 Tax=Aquimarina algiphila TaxID=2047982 RepID=UPI00232B821F|nr:serine hydrolase domain-containing protein [Aquimarina algiphila]
MKNTTTKIIILVFLFSVFGITLTNFDCIRTEEKFPKSISEKIDHHIKKYVEKDHYQGTVIVAKEGKAIHKSAYGYSNREEKIKNTIETQFLIGSLTKSFVAVTVMQLVEKEILDLHAPIQSYIPNLKNELSEHLTLHILLKHQSGLSPHLERITNFENKDVSSREIIQIINTSSLSFSPSTQYQYSNLNYTLSAIAVENATGKNFADVLQEYTFDPLQMNNSGVERIANRPKNRAKGYHKKAFGIENDENIVSYALGSGDIYSTVEDLLKWDQALYQNTLLSDKSKALLFKGENSEFGNYGYGFRIHEYQRGRNKGKKGILTRHGGTMDGFMSNLHRYTDDRLTVIILGNIRPFPIRNMTFELKEIALGLEANERNRTKFE